MRNKLIWLFIVTILATLFPYKIRAQTLPYAGSSIIEYESIPKENINRWQTLPSEAEKYLMAQIVYCEARGESDIGQQAVVEVILNRQKAALYPNNIEDVLSQTNQFETWEQHYDVIPTIKELKNVEKVLNGETYILPYTTVFFSTYPINRHIEIIIGGHVFCNLPIK